MTVLTQAQSGPGAVPATVSVTTAVALPVGSLVVLHVGGYTLSLDMASVSATDSKGNTYTSAFVQNSSGGTNFQAVLYKRLTTALAIGDTITVSFASAVERAALAMTAFSGFAIGSVVGPGLYDSAAVAVHPNTATVGSTVLTSVAAGSLGMGFLYLNSPARTFTADADDALTVGTKIQSSAASGDRAVQSMWKEDLANAASFAPSGSLNSGSILQFATLIFTPTTVPANPTFKEWNGTSWVTLTPKEWNGTAWVPLTAKEY